MRWQLSQVAISSPAFTRPTNALPQPHFAAAAGVAVLEGRKRDAAPTAPQRLIPGKQVFRGRFQGFGAKFRDDFALRLHRFNLRFVKRH